MTFQVSLDGQIIDTVDTDDSGTACVEGLVPGQTYTVTEIVPENYAASSTNPQSVTVSPGATCSKGTPDEVTFGNTPLSELQFIFHSLVRNKKT